MELQKLSIDQLKTLRAEVDAEISTRVAQGKKSALAQILKILQEFDMSVEEIFTHQGKAKTSPAIRPSLPPIYANPANPNETWCGMGRKPKWVMALTENGGSLDSARIMAN